MVSHRPFFSQWRSRFKYILHIRSKSQLDERRFILGGRRNLARMVTSGIRSAISQRGLTNAAKPPAAAGRKFQGVSTPNGGNTYRNNGFACRNLSYRRSIPSEETSPRRLRDSIVLPFPLYCSHVAPMGNCVSSEIYFHLPF